MMPAILSSSSSDSSTAFFCGAYPQDDTMLPTYDQAQDLIQFCNFSIGTYDGHPAYFIFGPQAFMPVIAPMLLVDDMGMDCGKFWVKSKDPSSNYAPFMLFSKDLITIGMTLKTSSCMALLPSVP